jgi:hypothetical protein
VAESSNGGPVEVFRIIFFLCCSSQAKPGSFSSWSSEERNIFLSKVSCIFSIVLRKCSSFLDIFELELERSLSSSELLAIIFTLFCFLVGNKLNDLIRS